MTGVGLGRVAKSVGGEGGVGPRVGPPPGVPNVVVAVVVLCDPNVSTLETRTPSPFSWLCTPPPPPTHTHTTNAITATTPNKKTRTHTHTHTHSDYRLYIDTLSGVSGVFQHQCIFLHPRKCFRRSALFEVLRCNSARGGGSTRLGMGCGGTRTRAETWIVWSGGLGGTFQWHNFTFL
jgi:hypothetical protein